MPEPRPISLAWRERPFHGEPRVITVAPEERGPSIGELIATANLPAHLAERGVVCLNGTEVPRAMWHRVRPRPDARTPIAVTVHYPLGNPGGSGSSGGSGSGAHKNPIAMVAIIAVLIIAAAVSGGALGALGFSLLASGTIGASIAGASIGIAGSLAVAALFPPPTLSTNQAQPTATAGNVSTGATPQAASLSGNVLAPGAAVPRAVGTMRLSPPLLCNPLIEVVGDIEVGEAVFGFAGPHAISNIWVGTTPIASMAGVDVEVQEGWPYSPTQSLVPRQSFTLAPGIKLTRHVVRKDFPYQLLDQNTPATGLPQWATFASRFAPDEIWINLAWPSGLFVNNSPLTAVNVPVRVQIRRRGDVSWINLPELHFSSNSPTPFQKAIRVKWGAAPVAPNVPPTAGGPILAYKVVPGQGASPGPATAGWTADASFSAGAGLDVMYGIGTSGGIVMAATNVKNVELYQDKAIFYLDPAAFPQNAYYDVQVMAGAPYAYASFALTTYLYTSAAPISDPSKLPPVPQVLDFFQYYLDAPNGVFRIPLDQSTIQEEVDITRVSSIWNQNPIQTKDFATISLKVQGQALSQLTALASGYVRNWDGTGWNNWTTTSNPAPHVYDMLTGTLGSRPLPVEMVDSAALVTWRQACIAKGYTVNAVLEGKTYMDALNMATAAGYARVRHSELWGVILDRDRSADAPIQMFGPRNMANFSWTRAFAQLPTGFRAVFNDAALDYTQNQIVVLDPTVDQTAFSQLEQMQYDGLVNAADVTARAKFDLAQARLRFTFYTGDTDLESIVCERGDLVGVQNDILTNQAGFARIKSIVYSAGPGSNVNGVVLEGTVPVPPDAAWSNEAAAWSSFSSAWSATKTGVAIRRLDQSLMTAQVTATDSLDPTTQLSFVTPFADPGSSVLAPDCLCAIGPLGQENRRLLVYGIAPKPDLTATVVFVDEAPGLWQ